MIDGVCPKCHQSEVYERQANLPASDPTDALRLRLFVCALCGYTETYTHAQHLIAIAQSNQWQHVRPEQPRGHAPVTGVTTRLPPPTSSNSAHTPAQDSSLEPKKHCPACQSSHLIPDVRVVDRSQSFLQNLTVEVDRRPQAFIFRDSTPSDVRAWICGRCGYMSLFVDEPRELLRAYNDTKH